MAKRQTYYDILRVSRDAEPEVITAAYRTLMTKLNKHPDKGGDTAEAALINRAYEILSNPAERMVYDGLIDASKEKPRAGEAKAAIERRRINRVSVAATVSYCLGHDQQWRCARVKDVSRLGIRLQSHSPFIVGQQMIIAPSNLASPTLEGVVRWTRVFHPSIFERVYEAGVEFHDQVEDIEKRLAV